MENNLQLRNFGKVQENIQVKVDMSNLLMAIRKYCTLTHGLLVTMIVHGAKNPSLKLSMIRYLRLNLKDYNLLYLNLWEEMLYSKSQDSILNRILVIRGGMYNLLVNSVKHLRQNKPVYELEKVNWLRADLDL